MCAITKRHTVGVWDKAVRLTSEEHDLYGMKRSELPPPTRRPTGWALMGAEVKDAAGVAAVFAELSSSASLMSASTLMAGAAMAPGCAGGQSVAGQAHTQANVGRRQTCRRMCAPP